MAKDAKKGKKAKKGGKGAGTGEIRPSVAAHPRARSSVRRLKAWGGLLGFVLAGCLSLRAGVEPYEAGLRALAAGVALYVIAWAGGITLWRFIVLGELRAEVRRVREAREEQLRRLAGEPDGAADEGNRRALA